MSLLENASSRQSIEVIQVTSFAPASATVFCRWDAFTPDLSDPGTILETYGKNCILIWIVEELPGLVISVGVLLEKLHD